MWQRARQLPLIRPCELPLDAADAGLVFFHRVKGPFEPDHPAVQASPLLGQLMLAPANLRL
jgi:hypothetical protein